MTHAQCMRLSSIIIAVAMITNLLQSATIQGGNCIIFGIFKTEDTFGKINFDLHKAQK